MSFTLEYTIRKFVALVLISLFTFFAVSRNLYPNISYLRNTSVVIITRATDSVFQGRDETKDVNDVLKQREIASTRLSGIHTKNVATTESSIEIKVEVNDYDIDEDDMEPLVTKTVSRLIPNPHPDEMLKCIHNRMSPHYSLLIKYREWVLEHPHTAEAYNLTHNTNKMLYAENKTYFQELKKLNNIQTFFFNDTVEEISKCLINGGKLQYEFGINNCSSVIEKAKRYLMFGKHLYDMHCFKKQEMGLQPSRLNDAAFQVGLPEGFEHTGNTKTLTYIHMISDAIVTVYGDVTTSTITLIPQRCFQDQQIPLPGRPSELPIYDEVFTLSQYYGKGMFHANIEDISRMAPYINFLRMFPTIKIHIYDLEFPPMYLSRIDIDPRRFINGTVRAKLLYMPPGVNCCLPTLFGTQVESFYLRRNLPNPQKTDRDVIILVRRRNRRGRYFKNHDKILEMLKAKAELYGLKVWEFNDSPLPTLNETAHQFNRAFIVIAPHGAGESNLIFSQPGTILLEGLCIDRHDGFINVVFRTLSHILGGFYYGFFKQDSHCTETTPEDLSPLLDFYLERLSEFR